MIHELKILPQYFEAVLSGNKPFEIRKNDRNFQVGDQVILKEYSKECSYTGRKVKCDIVYVMTDSEYVKEGFAVLGIKKKYLQFKCSNIKQALFVIAAINFVCINLEEFMNKHPNHKSFNCITDRYNSLVNFLTENNLGTIIKMNSEK